MKYNLTKVESAAGAAVVVADYLLMTGSPIKMAIGYGILAGVGAYFGKHFITNALANEQALIAPSATATTTATATATEVPKKN